MSDLRKRAGATTWSEVTVTDPTVTDTEGLDVDGVDMGDPAGAETLDRAARVPFAVLILALLGGGLCALLALNTVTAASEVRQRNIDAANASLNDSQQQLSRDLAALQAPDELARRAAALGLVPADSPAFLRLNPNGSATVLGAPAPVTTQPPPPAPTPSTIPSTTPAPARTTAKKAKTSTGAKARASKTKSKPTPTTTPTTTVTLPGGPR